MICAPKPYTYADFTGRAAHGWQISRPVRASGTKGRCSPKDHQAVIATLHLKPGQSENGQPLSEKKAEFRAGRSRNMYIQHVGPCHMQYMPPPNSESLHIALTAIAELAEKVLIMSPGSLDLNQAK